MKKFVSLAVAFVVVLFVGLVATSAIHAEDSDARKAVTEVRIERTREIAVALTRSASIEASVRVNSPRIRSGSSPMRQSRSAWRRVASRARMTLGASTTVRSAHHFARDSQPSASHCG